MKRALLIFAITLISLGIFAQEQYSTKKKKAIKYFESAIQYYNSRDNKSALFHAHKAIETDLNFVEPYNFIAAIYDEDGNYNKAIEYYNKAIIIAPSFSPNTYYFLGKLEYLTGNYESSTIHLKQCLEFENIKPKITHWAKEILKRSVFSENAVNNPVPFNPISLGKNINTKYNDYWPSLTADENILITTITIPIDDKYPISSRNIHEDFFISHKDEDGNWKKIKNIGAPINSKNNEGAQNFSADGQWLFYTVCNRPEDYGSCDIYYARKIGDKWNEPKNLGPDVNAGSWDCNPSMASDGRTLFFSSNRKGGEGSKDIWCTSLQDNGRWTKPENLGNKINTLGNESAPFIHPDNKTLYFASDGLVGLGELDIFMSRKQVNGEWGEPVNIGYPINTKGNEMGLIVNSSGNLALFSSERFGGEGMDIYSFDLYKEAQPERVFYVKGYVYDKATNKRLKANFELYNVEKDSLVVKSVSNPGNGSYLITLPTNNNYAFNVSKKGYMFYSENFSLKNFDDNKKPYEINIPLQVIEKNASIVLKNIFFEIDSYDLRLESRTELSKLFQFLNINSSLIVEISGHTDNVGSKQHNINLSTNRAKKVYEYLINKGISASRLSYKGYYFSRPIAKNDTEEGRAKNRRTEFKIISK